MKTTHIHQLSAVKRATLLRFKIQAVLTVLILLLLSGCTVVPIEELNAAKQSAQFDPVGYVDGVWQSQILPGIIENAVDAPTVLAAIDADIQKGGEAYGRFVGGSFNFMVKGQGTITAVDTSSRSGTMTVTLDGYQGPDMIIVQLGPSISGAALRDAGGVVLFGQFKDQTEFGKISRELNKRVADEIVSKLDPANLVGKTVSFSGVFAISTTNQTSIDLSTIIITPVAIELQ